MKMIKQNLNMKEDNDIKDFNKEGISLIKKGMYDVVNPPEI